MIFVTWRVVGSLYQKPHCASVAAIDHVLDRDASEPQILADAKYARIVKRSIERADGDLYRLRAWVVMHNHAHLLIEPTAGISMIARTIMDETEYSAHTEIWVRESYERLVVNEEAELIRLIEEHPVRAKLVSRPEDWAWSSIHSRPLRKGMASGQAVVRRGSREAA